QVRRAGSLVPLATLPGLLTRASLLSSTASSPSHLARASCNLAGSALPCEFTFLLSKFGEPALSCLLQHYRVCSPVRVYFPAPQVRRATSLVPLATLPGLLSRASLLFSLASSASRLSRASCNITGFAHPCEFTFQHRKFAEPPRSCLLQPCRVCSPQVRRAGSLVPLATLPGLLTRASLLSSTASSPSHLARASCNLAGSALPCEFTFLLSKFGEPALSCLLQHYRVCSPVRVYFPAPQVRRATSLVPLATLPGLLSRASLLFSLASSASRLSRASCNITGFAHPCEFTFQHRKFAEPPRSCLLQPCRVCSPQVRRAGSLVPLATLPGLLTRASLLSSTASSPSHLARASCNLAGSALPCEFTFLLSKFGEPALSCLLQHYRVCSPVRVYFPAPQVRRATSLVPLATLPGLLSRASLLFSLASSASRLSRASCNITGFAHPCEFTFQHRKFAEPPRSCLLQPCRVCSPQVRRAGSLVPLATLPGLLTRASLLSSTASSPSHLARASCNLAGSALPCEFTFLLSKFGEPALSCLLQHYRVCSPVRVYFPAPQVRRATSLVPLATLPGLLSRASLLFSLASSASRLSRASCNITGFAHPCEFTFQHRKFAEPPRSCLLQPCRVCSPVRVYFSAKQDRRASSLVPLATLPGLLTRASLLFCLASSPSQLAGASSNLAGSAHFRRAYSLLPLATLPGLLTRASLLFSLASSASRLSRASCNITGFAHPCEFTFLLSKFGEPALSCLLQHYRQVRRAGSLVPLATLPGLLTRASLLFSLASSASRLSRASCNITGFAHPCEFTFLLSKFGEPALSCLLQHYRQVRRAGSLVPLATLPGLLTRASLLFSLASSASRLSRASCNITGFAHPCEFTFLLSKFGEPALSCLLQHYRQVRRAGSLVPLATLPGLLTRASLLFSLASSASRLSRASCNITGFAHPCEFTFLLSKFGEPALSCLLQHYRQVRRAGSLVPLATLPGLLTRASLLFSLASSASRLSRASCNITGFAHPCEFTFLLSKFGEPALSCLLQHYRQVRRAGSLVPLATLPGLLTRASLLFSLASSASRLSRASCNITGFAHPCEFTFLLSKFGEPALSCLLQHYRQVRRAGSLVPLATLPGLLTRASLLFSLASSASRLSRASCNITGFAHPCEFTFLLSKFGEPALSCLLQHYRVCSPVRVYFSASQVHRACSLVPLATLPGLLTQICRAISLQPLATLPGLLTRASLLFCLASSPSRLARASCNLAGPAHPCEFSFLLQKFAEPYRSSLLQPCLQVHRAGSLVPLATLPVLLTRASLVFCFRNLPSHIAPASCNLAWSAHPCEFTFLLSKFTEPARSCLLQPCRSCSPQVHRAGSLVPLATLPVLLTRASLVFCFRNLPSHIAPASCNLAWSAHPCEFTFLLSKFTEPARSCLLQPCRSCSPQVHRAGSLVPLATLPVLLTRASLVFCFRNLPSHIAPASCNLAWSAHPCEFTFLLSKFTEPARSCLLQPCRSCSPQVHRAGSLVPLATLPVLLTQICRAISLQPLATLPGLLTRASLLFCLASSPSRLARASCNLAGPAHPCEFSFLLTKFAEPARSCLLQPCRFSSPVRAYFPASEIRRAISLLPLATLPGLLTRASLLFCLASSPSQLARASCNLAGPAHPCEFTFLLRKFAEPYRSCLLQPCLVCSPVRVYFSASKIRRASSLVPLATLPGLLNSASLLFCFASSPSLLAHASCNLAWSALPCEFSFLLSKFAEPARSCQLQPCRFCSPVRAYFSASEIRRAISLLPLATLPGLLSRASLVFCLASSPSPLARANCNLAGSAHLCELTFLLRKFAEPYRSCLLQPCLQVRRANSPVPLATLPVLLTRASLLFFFGNSPSHISPASCNLAGSAHPCEFTFLLSKIAEPARSCLLQPCRFCSPVRVYFFGSQVRRAYSLLPLATLPGLLTRAILLFCIASSPSLLARASYNLAGSAHPCELTFLLRKFAEPARSCLLQPCRVCSPVRAYFSASQVRRACSLVPLTTLPGLLTRASLLFCFASSPSLLARASYNLAGSAHPCELTFLLRKFAEPARSCLLQPCRVCSPVRAYFSASQVRRACSLVPLTTLPGLLTRASLLFCFASSPSLLARASYNLAGSAHPCELTFLLRKFAEPARSCLLQPCRVCSPVRAYFSASQVRRACSLVPLTTLPGLLTRASLLFCFASSPSLLARASYNLAGSAHPCELTFLLRKFAEPARSCLLQPCRVCSPVRAYFSASQVRRACSLVPLTTLPGLLTRASLLFCFASSPSLLARASYNLAGSAHPCELTFLLRKFAEPARSCLLQPCRVCSPVRAYFSASQVRRACSLVPLTTLPGLLTRASLLFCFASSPSLLARASYNLAGSAHPCELTFLLRKFAEPARSCLLQPCRVCSPFSAYQVRRASSLVPLTTLPVLLTRARLLFFFGNSPSQIAPASCNLTWSAPPCEFTFLLRKFAEPARSCFLRPCRSAHPCEFSFLLTKFAEPARSCLLQPCLFCSPVRDYFSSSEIRRAKSLLPLATLPGLLPRASLLFCFGNSPSQLARASCDLAGLLTRASLVFCLPSSPSQLARASYNLACSAHPCEITFLLRKFAEPNRSCLLQPYLVCSPVRVYFSASEIRRASSLVLLATLPFSAYQVRRASSLVPLTTLPVLLTRARLLFFFGNSPSQIAPASCNLTWSAPPCEFTFLLRKFAEPARSCFLRPCRSAHPCEFSFLLTKFAEPARSCLLQPCLFCSPVRDYFSSSEIRRAKSLLPLATLPGLLPRASLLFCFGNSPSQLARASCDLAGLLTRASLVFCLPSSPSQLARASYNLACSAHPCEITFLLRKFAEPNRSCLLQPYLVCSPVRVYFSASEIRRASSLVLLATLPFSAYQVRRASSLVPLTTLPVLLTRARLLFFFGNSPSQIAPASCNLTWSAPPCEFTFLLRKFAEPARSCFLRPCRSAHPCEFSFLLTKFAEPARSCLLQPCLFCSPVRDYFSSSEIRRAKSLLPLATLPGLLPRASLLFCFGNSPSQLARASCDLAGLLTRASLVFCLPSSPSQLARASYNLACSAHPCEITFLLRKFAEPNRSCLLQPYLVCSPVRVYFSASEIRRASSLVLLATLPQVRRAGLLVPLATLPGLLTRASLLFCFARSPCQLTRSSCNLARSALLFEFSFLLIKFAEPARSCLLQPCRFCSPVRAYFFASEIRRAKSLLPLATLPGLLPRASLLFCFGNSPSQLARASCNLAGSTHSCEFTFLLRKFAEPARSCLSQPCRFCSPVRVYFSASEIRRAISLLPLATLPGLLTRASLLFCFASSPSLLARASRNLAGSAHPCEFTFRLRKFAEPYRSCLLQPCLVCSPVRVYFSASQVRRACSLVPLATLPVLLTRASLLFGFGNSPSHIAPASCNLAWSAHPCEFTFLLRKFAEPARSCLSQPCRFCSPVRVYFSASEIRRAISLLPLATLPGLLTRASLLFCFASSPSLLARASRNLAGSAHPCEFTFRLRKFAEPYRSCLLQPCLVCSPVRVYFSASQVRRACSLVPLATLPVLLTRASLLFGFGNSPSHIAPASCNLAWSAHPCEFTFLLRKFAEPARSCLSQPCRFCSPVRVYFSASEIRRAISLLPLATLPGLLTRASLLFCFASSPSLLARASRNLAGSAHPCEFTFRLRKFAEPYRSCLLQPCLVCSPVRVYFSASQVRRACSLVPLATLPVLLTRASLLFGFGNSPSHIAPASCNLAWSAHPCEFTFLLRKFAEPARSCLSQPCRFCSPVRVYFSASEIRRAISLLPLATLPGLLTRASLLFCFASSPSLLARASRNLAGSAHPCEFTFRLRKFAEPYRSCLLQPCLVCSPVRVYFSASQVRRACSLVPLATLPVLLTRASLLFGFGNSPSHIAPASCNLAWSAHPCEFTFLLRKFAEPARSCLSQPCRFCSPVRVYFSASEIRRAISLLPLATLPGLLTRASLLFCFASSPSLLARASRNLAGSAHPCEFTFRLRKFAEPYRSCLLQPCLVCSPVRVYFSASQVRRACSLVPLATLPVLLTRASLLFGFGNSPSHIAPASCNLAWSAHPCEFTFLLSKFAEPARSCLLQPCRVCSPVRVYFFASHVRRASSLLPLATMPGLLTRAILLFCFASSTSMLVRASYNLACSAHPYEFTFLLRKFAEPARSCLSQPCRSLVPLATLPVLLTRTSSLFCFGNSPSQLARASRNLAGSVDPYEFTFLLRKFAEPARSCLLQPCRFCSPQPCWVCSPVRAYFSASHVRRACSLVPLATLPVLLTRASLLFCFACSPSLLARASRNLAGTAHPCELTFLLRMFAEPARSCLSQPCRYCSPVRAYFSASHVRRACSLVPLATLPVLLTRASLLFCFACSPSLLARASRNLAGTAHPCELTFLLRMFAEPARSCLSQPCRYCSPVRAYFSASHVRRACSLVPLATLPVLLTRASLLFCFACSPSLLARASRNLAGTAHPCELTFLLRMFAEPARSCLSQPCRYCSPVRAYFSASHVRRACSLVPLATLPVLLTRASLLFCFACSPSLLARASRNLAGTAHPCELTFLLRMFAEPARSCLSQPCRYCSPVRAYFSASHVRRACSLVPLATLPVLLTRASLLFCFACSPSLLARASRNLAGTAHPCELTFLLRMFAEPARSCLSQPCRYCSPVRAYFSASHVRRACSLVPLATLPVLLTRASLLFCFACSPSLLARASRNLAGTAHPCELTFLLRMFAEPARSCLSQPCRYCSPVRAYFSASHVRRACSLVPLATLPVLLTRASLLFCFACSPSLLARASRNLAGTAHPCELTFLLRMFAEPARSCLSQPCRYCSPVRAYFSASHVRRACSLVPLATLPVLLTRASLLFCFACSPSLLARASRNLAGTAHPCELTFLLRMFAEPARSCLSQPCRYCSPVRAYFSASHVRRACSLVPLATLPVLLTRASLLFCFACSPSLLARASRNLAGTAHPCELTFLLRMFAEPARSCLSQPCRYCSPVRAYFSASHVRRACSLVPLATLPVLLTRASLLFCFACSPSLLARASRNLAGTAHPCELTFLLRMFAEPARSCLSQPCRYCSPVRAYFSASHVRRACSLVPLATLPVLLTRASLLFCFACSPSLLARASRNLAGTAHPCELTFLLRMFAEPARSCLSQPCRYCSPVRAYFSASHVRRACSLLPLATLPGLLTRAILFFCFASSPSLPARASCNLAGPAHPCEFTFLFRKFADPTRSCLLQPCRVCSPVRAYFSASEIRRAISLQPLATLPGLLTRASLLFCFGNSPSHFAPASCNLAWSAHPCEFTFLLSKFAEPTRSCLLQPCRVCSPVRVYFSRLQVHRACSLVPLATLPVLLTRASLLFCCASSPSLLAPASSNLAGSAHPCDFTFLLRKFTEPARSCLLQPCRVCSPVRVYFSVSKVRRSYSLVPLTTLPGVLTRASLLFCFKSSPILLARASYNLAGCTHPCEFAFLLREFVEHARLCQLQPCQ
ncbi:hypothetical protein CRG98_030349, partial [Punica granatum]